jgi:hypothetical protein
MCGAIPPLPTRLQGAVLTQVQHEPSQRGIWLGTGIISRTGTINTSVKAPDVSHMSMLDDCYISDICIALLVCFFSICS